MGEVCTFNVRRERIGSSCPECGHNGFVHPGSTSPVIEECLLCRLVYEIEKVKEDRVHWDIDANLPTYTRDFLRLIDEGKLDNICTYGTVTH